MGAPTATTPSLLEPGVSADHWHQWACLSRWAVRGEYSWMHVLLCVHMWAYGPAVYMHNVACV